jgi:hypothetical protein
MRAALAAVLTLAVAAPAAHAAFGVEQFNAEVRKSATPGDLETQAGANPYDGVTDFTFKTSGLTPDGNVKNIRVDLPPGLVSNPEATPKCTEAQFPNCPAATKLGTETLTAGATVVPPVVVDVYNMVPKPGQVSLFSFNAPVFGRTDIVGGIRSPGDFGLYFTISDVPQNSNLVRSILTFYGVPANRNGGGQKPVGFITLPTFCGPPQTTTLTVESHAGEKVVATSTTPTGATGCDKLPFSPEIAATTPGRTSKTAGAGLSVAVSQQPGEANIKSVSVQLPKVFSARGTTLALVCPDATFRADPATCGEGSRVGSAEAITPLLPAPITGPAYLVGVPGKLPTLEVILQAPAFNIGLSSAITLSDTGLTSTFGAVPDLPISRFTLDLPQGKNSALGTAADLCAGALTLPATFTAHSGKEVTKTFAVKVTDCPVKIVKAHVKGGAATLSVRAPGAGAVTISGPGLRKVKRSVSGRSRFSVKVALTKNGVAARRKARRSHKRLKVKAIATFAPAAGAEATASKAGRTLTFK